MIGVIALLVIGPKQLPEVARVVGRLFGEVKKATEDLSGGLLSATKEVRTVMDDAANLNTDSANHASDHDDGHREYSDEHDSDSSHHHHDAHANTEDSGDGRKDG